MVCALSSNLPPPFSRVCAHTIIHTHTHNHQFPLQCKAKEALVLGYICPQSKKCDAMSVQCIPHSPSGQHTRTTVHVVLKLECLQSIYTETALKSATTGNYMQVRSATLQTYNTVKYGEKKDSNKQNILESEPQLQTKTKKSNTKHSSKKNFIHIFMSA